jgi:hypothetical protein
MPTGPRYEAVSAHGRTTNWKVPVAAARDEGHGLVAKLGGTFPDGQRVEARIDTELVG